MNFYPSLVTLGYVLFYSSERSHQRLAYFYTDAAYHKYHALYPSARIITLSSPPEVFISTSTASRLASFKPVVSAIDTSPNPRILLHVFSNGGALTTADICTVYKRSTSKLLPISALILDSAPGKPTIQEGWAAMSIGLPKGIMWYPGAAFVAAGVGLAGFVQWAFGWETLVHTTGRMMNDGRLVERGAKRLYVFSEKDALVGWRDVEAHVEEARKTGVNVEVLKETDTPHVQHMLLDAERYWAKVEELWRSTV